MRIKIVIADKERLTRDGIKLLLEGKGYTVVGVTDNSQAAIELVKTHQPEVLIIEMSLWPMSGIELTRKLKKIYPGLKVIALSHFSERDLVSELFKAGGNGYILKDCGFEELISAIDSVLNHRKYICPQLTNSLVDSYVYTFSQLEKSETASDSPLTTREREILQLIAEGKATKDIADMLEISVKTVETHRRQIMHKLNMFNIAQLTQYALREGFISV